MLAVLYVVESGVERGGVLQVPGQKLDERLVHGRWVAHQWS
jgi:hypothetical protein